ncbi:hypothetical protein ABZ468_38030 [Streptomyces sp. NPDC005708]|uniref:hypothetical protein n=1 Tax=Streptomyces sp. NPDC005708 TaxID=3154564 RepID=UPI00340D2183
MRSGVARSQALDTDAQTEADRAAIDACAVRQTDLRTTDQKPAECAAALGAIRLHRIFDRLRSPLGKARLCKMRLVLCSPIAQHPLGLRNR